VASSGYQENIRRWGAINVNIIPQDTSPLDLHSRWPPAMENYLNQLMNHAPVLAELVIALIIWSGMQV